MKTSNRFAVLAGVAAIAFAISSASAQTTTTGSCVFNTNLKVGQRSADVINLQKVLNSNPATSIGNAGKETNFFGPATFAAVKKFQAANDITPVSGFVGALTRAALTKACSTGGSTSTTNVVNTDTPKTTTNNNNVVSNNNIPSVLVAGSARAHIADFTFNGNNIITAVKLQRTGVSNNSIFNSLYLYDGNNRVGDSVGVNSDGTITWNNTNGLFQVSGSKVISVYADILKAGASGQTVGVALLGYTAQGASPVVLSPAIAGPVLSVGSVELTTVSLTQVPSNVGPSVQAGAQGVSLWRSSVSVSSSNGGNGVNFSGLTLKTIGSAPLNAFNNYKLYVNGVQQGTASTLDNNNRVSFLFTPMLLKSGSYTIEVRADNQAGSGRTVQFALESTGDALFTDTNVGANVAITYSTTNNPCNTYWTITCGQVAVATKITEGILSIQEDTTLPTNKLVGGSTGAVIAKYIIRAYGEDSKMYAVNVTPTFTGGIANGVSGNTLRNIGVYLSGTNGTQQIGQLKSNWTTGDGAITFNTNSNFVVTAGTSTTLEVRADLVNSNGVAYTAGSLSAAVSGTAYANGNNGQNASGFSTTLTGTTNTTLSIGSADASISISGAITKNVSALTGTNLGSFVFTAGQSEDIRLDQVTINLAGTLSTATINGAPGFNLLRNVSLYKVNGSSSVLVGSPNNYGLSSLVFNTNGLVVARNTSVTFNLTADVDSAIVTGATTYNVTAIANTTFVGNSSQTPGTKISSAVTSTITRASFAAPVLSGSELLAGYVIGGVNVSNAAAYTLRTNTGETRVDELEFTVIGSVSLIEELKVNGVPGVKDGNVIRFANNLNIPVTTTGAEILVNVKPTCFNGPACNSNSLNPNSFSLALTKIGSEQSTVSDWTGSVAANTLRVVSSKPSNVSVNNSSSNYGAGAQKIGEIRVTADNAGSINVRKLTFNTILNNGVTATSPYLTLNDSSVVSNDGVVTPASITSGTDYSFTISATSSVGRVGSGTTKIFNVYATLSAAPSSTGGRITPVSTQISRDQTNALKWSEAITDVNGNYTEENGVGVLGISTTNSYSLTIN